MNTTTIKRNIVLFPNYCKWIGTALIVLSAIIFILQTQTNFLAFDVEYSIPLTLLIGGLALVNFSKEKVEDERIRKIRYRTLAYSFYTMVAWVFIGRIINSIFESTLEFYNSATALLILILTTNFMSFSANKDLDLDEE